LRVARIICKDAGLLSSRRLIAILASFALLVAAAPARAVDVFEIQVYEGDINEPLQPGLELHTNFTAAGRRTPAFPGEAVPHHALRTTLEPSLGILPWWELGAYLEAATAPGRGEARFGGWKVRSKFIVPQAKTGAFTLGLNLEVGRGVAALGSDAWDAELRPIIAWAQGRFFAAVNPIIGWELSGGSLVPELEPCAKVRVDAGHHVGVGLEYYTGLGRASDLLPLGQQEHFLYLVGDLLDGPFELNGGVGRGLTGGSDDWTIKVIVGHVF
jgi:hypothetical protein